MVVPIYEYGCRKCGKVTERLQWVHDPDLRKCPACGGRVERRMSSTSFVLKGSGWYATDYASSNGTDPGKDRKKGKAACPAADDAKPACAGCPKATT